MVSEDGSECFKLGSISSGADGMGEGSEYQSWDLYPAGRMVWEKDQNIKAGICIHAESISTVQL